MERRRVRDFRDLIVWQRAVSLHGAVDVLCRRLPRDEQRRLGDQLRRAVASVGANIAEGHSKPYRREFLRFLHIAYASLKEAEHHLLTAVALRHLHQEDAADALSLASEVGRMLTAMKRRLEE